MKEPKKFKIALFFYIIVLIILGIVLGIIGILVFDKNMIPNIFLNFISDN